MLNIFSCFTGHFSLHLWVFKIRGVRARPWGRAGTPRMVGRTAALLPGWASSPLEREAGAAYSLVWFQEHLAMHLTSFRFELVIVWRIQIDEEGKVLPKLDLLTKVPLQGRDVLVISHYAQHRHLLISSGFIWQESKVKNFISVLFKSVFKIFLSIITQKAQARGTAPPRPS